MPTTTLVTGANGFVGATIVDVLLSPAYNHDKIIIAIRRANAADSLLSANPSWPRDKIHTQVIPDFTAPGAFDAAFQDHPDIDYVIHVAAPVLDNPANSDFVEHFQKPSEAGNRELLTAAQKYGGNLKAISITGSINAITTGAQDDIKSRVISSSEWLPLGVEDAVKMQNPFVSNPLPLHYLLLTSHSHRVPNPLGNCPPSQKPLT